MAKPRRHVGTVTDPSWYQAINDMIDANDWRFVVRLAYIAQEATEPRGLIQSKLLEKKSSVPYSNNQKGES